MGKFHSYDYIWYGIMMFPYGTKYKGHFKSGNPNGKGLFIFMRKEGVYVYDGNWLDGKKQGNGKLIYPSGNYYDGNWNDNRKEGLGVFYWKSKMQKYDGEWKNDKPHGVGKYAWDYSGERNIQHPFNLYYHGDWVDGLRHGNGMFCYTDGSIYKGEWKQDKKHGKGIYICSRGDHYFGLFENDGMVKKAGQDVYSTCPFVFKTIDKMSVDQTIKKSLLDTIGEIFQRNQNKLFEIYQLIISFKESNKIQCDYFVTFEDVWIYFGLIFQIQDFNTNLVTITKTFINQQTHYLDEQIKPFKPSQRVLFNDFLEILLIIFTSKESLNPSLTENNLETLIKNLPSQIPPLVSNYLETFIQYSKQSNMIYDKLVTKYKKSNQDDLKECLTFQGLTIRNLLFGLESIGIVKDNKYTINPKEFIDICCQIMKFNIKGYNDFSKQMVHTEFLSLLLNLSETRKIKSLNHHPIVPKKETQRGSTLFLNENEHDEIKTVEKGKSNYNLFISEQTLSPQPNNKNTTNKTEMKNEKELVKALKEKEKEREAAVFVSQSILHSQRILFELNHVVEEDLLPGFIKSGMSTLDILDSIIQTLLK